MTTTLRPLIREDLKIVSEWLAAPHIRETWGDPIKNLAEIREFLDSASRPWGRCYLILQGERPVGYIQTYSCHGEPDPYWKSKVQPGSWGFDLFIGVRNLWGRGIAKAAIRLLLDEHRKNPEFIQLIVDPHTENFRAIRLYEKLGFIGKQVLFDHPEGSNLLMVFPR